MTVATSELIHPTAVIDPEAMLAPDVQVGPYAIIEGPVEITHLRAARAGDWDAAGTVELAASRCAWNLGRLGDALCDEELELEFAPVKRGA